MARRGSRARQRDATPIPTPRVLPEPPVLRSLARLRAAARSVAALEDRRRFHPLGVFAPPRATRRDAARIVNPLRRARSVFAFKTPQLVSVCAKRQRRRQVLFARNLTGKGARSLRRRRNENSNISCRR